MAYFTERVECDTAILKSLAEKFALLYAAGMLARKFGIVDWSRQKMLNALTKNFDAAASLMPPGPSANLRQGKIRLRTALNSLPLESDWLTSSSKAIGFQRKGKPITYVVKRDRMHELFESTEQRKLTMDWLEADGRLAMSSAKSSSNARIKQQAIWPDRRRRRSYTIYRASRA